MKAQSVRADDSHLNSKADSGQSPEAPPDSIPPPQTAPRFTQALFDTLLEGLPLALVTIDRDGRVQAWNPAAERLFGWQAAEVLGQPLPIVPEAGQPEFRTLLEAELHGAQQDGLELERLRKDGSRVTVSLWTVPVRDNTGAIMGIIDLFADVSARTRVEAALAERTRQLEALGAVTAEITRELDLPTALQLITQRACELTGASAGNLYLWDEAGQVLTRATAFGRATGRQAIPRRLGEGVLGIVAQRREGVRINDYRACPWAHPTTLAQTGITVVLTEPLLYGERLLGVIGLDREEAGHPFTDGDQATLRRFATQAGIAIENARLHAATQRELAERMRAQAELRGSEEQARSLAHENAVMAELGRIISSTLNIEDVYESFAAAVRKILPFDRIVINSINLEKNIVRNVFIAGEGLQDRNTADLYPLEGSGNAEMVRTRTSLLIQTEDFGAYADRFPALVSTFQAGFCSILNVPLFAKGQVIGGLLLRSRQPNVYSERDVRLAERIGSQIAGTIANAQLYFENARLYEAAQQEIAERRQAEEALAIRSRHLEAVRGISEEITRELDLTAVLGLIVQRAVALVGATSGNIRLWDESLQRLSPVAWTGSDRHMPTLPLRLGEGVSGATAQQRRGLIVNDFRTSPYAIPALLEGTTHTAVMATPLLYGDRLVGALAITRDENDPPFVDADLQALSLFAPHASIAIENARLFREQQHAYLELQRTQHELVRSEKLRSLGQLAAGVAHDLNNTLAAILGQVELLKLRGVPEGIRDSLDTLETAATDGAQVVRRLQDFARQRGHRALMAVRVDKVVREALEITRPQWEDEPQRHGLAIQVLADLPDLPPILGDASEFREALTNLILNAVDAMPHGGSLTFRGAAERTGVVLHVTDTGIGMPEEVQRRIFEPFFSTKGGHGTGLGLSVVYGIMERHGGNIQVRSAVGQGTTFTLHFQAAPPVTEALPQLGQPPSRPCRILVIDDDAAVRTTLVDLLRAAGHQVADAEGGAAGLAHLDRDGFDLVLTDLGMPEMTGWEVAAAIKDRFPSLPIILLTGWGEPIESNALATRRIDRVLGKPIRLDDLLRTITALCPGAVSPPVP